jgi:hypothetical protein
MRITMATIGSRDRRGRSNNEPSAGGLMRGAVVALPHR